jgi:hypothetical protein
VKGNFIPPASMNRITFVLTECVPSYKALIESQARLLDLRAQIVVTSSKAIAAAETLADEEKERGLHWKEAYKDEHQALESEREAHSGVLSSPTFWLGVGVVVGVAATLGVAYAYDRVRQGAVQ